MDKVDLFKQVEDWTTINVDNARFILEESKSRVNYLLEIGNKISDRVFTILSLLFPIEAALVAFVVVEKMKGQLSDKIITNLLLFVLVSLVIVMIFLGKIVLPRLSIPAGREPKEICSQKEFLIDDGSKTVNLAIILNEIENCQNKIDFCSLQNIRRTSELKLCMLSILAIVIIAISTILVYSF